ncbi:MAG: autotransporter domain-containing protein [Alphaproteobacteria bacterium]|nr:autotransporter domain-containing protein [Alphaproteobacteria bacterium]
MKQTRTTLKELTARYRTVLLKCAVINMMLCSAAGAASISDVTDSAGNRYFGSFGVPLRIYNSDSTIGTYYAVSSDLMGDAVISGQTLTLNNASRIGSGNLSWTQSTGAYAEVLSGLTESQISSSVNNIGAVLTAMNGNADTRDYDALPAGIKEALNVPFDGGQSIAEYLQDTWPASSADIDSPSGVKAALGTAYSSLATNLRGDQSVTITGSNLTLSGTSAIVNRSTYSPAAKGDIAISSSTITATGTISLIAHTDIEFTENSVLAVEKNATLTVHSSGDRVSLTNSNLTLDGAITGNVTLSGTVALKGTGSVNGNLNAAASSVLNMQNSAIDSITAGTVTGGNFSVALDVNAVAGTIDHFTATSFTTGTVTISGLNFLSAQQNFSLNVFNGTTTNATLVLAEALNTAYNGTTNIAETVNNLSATANWGTAFTETEYTVNVTRSLAVQNNKTLAFTITENSRTPTAVTPLGDTVKLLNTMDEATRTLTNSTSAASYTVTENLGTTAEGTYTINGAKSDSSAATINMGGYTGFSVAGSATLNLQSIVFSGNTAADGSILTVAGGTAALSNVTIGNAVSVTSGTLTLSGGNSLGGLVNAGTVSLTGNNAVGAMSGAGTLTNNGNLTLNGTTNAQVIGGTGRTYINAALTTTAAINQAITINSGKTLTIGAGNIGGAVTNGGTLALTEGTLGQTVTGGAVQITENVTSNVALNNVTITAGNKLTIGAGNIGTGLTNNGILALSGGTLTRTLSGTVHIDGNVTSNVALSNTTINATKQLTIGAGNVGSGLTIANNGTLVLTAGTLSNALSGTGAVQINGNVVSNVDLANVTINAGNKLTISAGYVDGTFTNNGILALSGGTLGTAVAGTVQIAGNVTSNVALSNATINPSKQLTIGAGNVGAGTANNGTLVLTAGTLNNALSGSGTVRINGDVVSNVALSNVTINSGRKLTISADSVNGTFTNNGILALSGGTLNTLAPGTVHVDGDVVSNVLMANTTINSGKQLTISANNVGANLTNGGTLVLTGGTLRRTFAGAGNVQIDGNVVSNVDLANVTINAAKQLTIGAGNIGTGLTNNGKLVLTDGILSNAPAAGGGTIQIAGNVISVVDLANVTINENKRLTINADYVDDGEFTNNGILALSGGTLDTAVAGTGSILINGDVVSNVALSNATIGNEKTLTIGAGNVGAGLTNNGTVVLTAGTLNNALSGTGAVQIDADVTSNVALSNTTINATKQLTISAGNVGAGFENNGTVVLTAGTLNNALSGAGSVRISEDVVSNAALSNVTVEAGRTLTLSADHVGGDFTNNGTVVLQSGSISRPLSGNVTATGFIETKQGSDFSGAQIDATNGVFDIGENTLTSDTLRGGDVWLDLKEYAAAEPIITTTPSDTVALTVFPVNVTNKAVQHYTLTSTADGYSLDFVLAPFFAVSQTPFDKENAMNIGAFDETAWTGGDLYVVALNVAEIAVSELVKNGYTVSANEKNTTKKLADDLEDILSGQYQNNYEKVNEALLFGFLEEDYVRIKAILDETGTEATPATSQTAVTNAQAVMSVVSLRMDGVSGMSSVKGRSGGDFVAGDSAVWAQGLMNKAELNGTNGFDSDSTGFAAGFERNINEDIKVGVGYAFASTDIKTDRSKTSVDTHTGFIYASYKPQAFYINGAFGYGRSAYGEKTKLLGLQSDYKAETLFAQAMAGYAVDFFAPEAGLRYTNVNEKSYTDALGARINGKTLQTWTAVAGAAAAKDFRLEKGTISAQVKVALTYDLKQGEPDKTVSLANGTSYVVQGKNMKRFGSEIGAGVSYKLNGKTEIGVSYEGKFKKRYADHTGILNIKYGF